MLDWQRVLATINVFLAVGIVVVTVRNYKASRMPKALRVLYIVIGAYWALLYVYVALPGIDIFDPVTFGQIFVRPAFTVTLAAMLASGLSYWRSRE